MDELRTNTTLRIAAIAFAIFLVVGTVLIFAFPDNASTPDDNSSGKPTVGAAIVTQIVPLNATQLAQATPPRPTVLPSE